MQSTVWRGQHHQAPRRIDEDSSSPQQSNMQYGYNAQQQMHQQQQHQQQQQQMQQVQNQQGGQQQGQPVAQQQQQQQQPQQQLQAVDQNGNPIPVNPNQNSNAGDGSSQGGSQNPPMNLASVLHYLQSEWRRWERDRNEWEIERAEMRVRSSDNSSSHSVGADRPAFAMLLFHSVMRCR
jgi:striatin 1/3/4